MSFINLTYKMMSIASALFSFGATAFLCVLFAVTPLSGYIGALFLWAAVSTIAATLLFWKAGGKLKTKYTLFWMVIPWAAFLLGPVSLYLVLSFGARS